jgi:hypothetical protein
MITLQELMSQFLDKEENDDACNDEHAAFELVLRVVVMMMIVFFFLNRSDVMRMLVASHVWKCMKEHIAEKTAGRKRKHNIDHLVAALF